VSNPRDEIDDWLDSDVQPLAPAPGAFQRVRQRARRRKASRAIVSAAGAVVLIAAVAAVPRLAATLQGSTRPAGRNVAAGRPTSARPAASASKGSEPAKSPSPSPLPSRSPGPALSASPSGQNVTSRFQPTSITMIGPTDGAVIGQANCTAADAGRCTALAGTTDYGASWYAVGAPGAGAPGGPTGASQLRFLHFDDGWAFGPALYATTDGGSTWTAESTDGRRVTDLETAGERAFAVFASCTGSGTDYAASCTSFSLYSSAAGSTTWQPVPVPRAYRSMTGSGAGQPAAASLVLASGTVANPQAGTGYLLTPAGELLSGPLTGGRWTAIGHIPGQCHVGQAQPTGQPAGVQFASGPAAQPQLLLSCNGQAGAGGRTQAKAIYISADGVTWQRAGTALPGGTATSLAAAGGGLVVLATSTGIDFSANGGVSWSPASIPLPPAGGFSYVGMTNASQGVAVPANPRLGEVFTTSDGGQAWTPAPVR
jgi:photosystem II stability/assembly factor-like uncharacterized protein